MPTLSPKEQWSETMNGATLKAFPDLYSNYWEYTWLKQSTEGMALCFKGEFPQARFMSFSLYNDANGSAVNGIVNQDIIHWSICMGSPFDTRSYYSINYEQAAVPDGEKCYFVVAMKQNEQLEEVRRKVESQNAKGIHTNLIVWDRERLNIDNKKIGNIIVTMYRNILANPAWEHSMANMVPTSYGNPVDRAQADPDHMIARRALGEYGPHGTKVLTADYLK